MARAMNTMSMTGGRRATIADVARLAGVSIKTVSRVANGEANVREATRVRVQDVIDELEYEANPFARYLGSLPKQATARPSAKTEQDAGL